MNHETVHKPLLLVFPYDALAHYLRCIRLAKYFRPWFHIRFLYSGRYHSFVSEAGFTTFECATLNADKVQQCVQAFDFSWLNEKDLSYIYKQQVKLLNEQQPSLVIGDMAPTLRMATEKTGVKYVSLINAYMSRYYAYGRKMPRSHPLYRLFNLLPPSLSAYFSAIGENIYFRNIHEPFSKIRHEEGLSNKYTYLQELEGDLNLLADLAELFPQKDLPENYQFIPPLFHPLNGNNDIIRDQLDANKKTILVNMGSTGNWQHVAFLNEPHYSKYNIITAGDQKRIVSGSNVVAFPFLNNRTLFDVVDLVICHGGNGTSYQALSCGIPVLCYTSHLEQEYNADGLERWGLGLCLNGIASQKYPAFIDEWICKKTNHPFTGIREKIAQEASRCGTLIQDLITNHLK